MIWITKKALDLLRTLNLSCPMTEKGEDILVLYQREKLNLAEFANKLPLVSYTLYSCLKPHERKIEPSIVVKAFGSEIHFTQTNQRLASGFVMIKGKLFPFLKFLAEKSIYLDSEENEATLTILDTLLLAEIVSLSKTKNERMRADLLTNSITLANAAIPTHLNKIKKGQKVLTHYGAVITTITPDIQKAALEIDKAQKSNPFFSERLQKLSGKIIDCRNICPSQKGEKGINLTAYCEARM